jgi:hypothetical protein
MHLGTQEDQKRMSNFLELELLVWVLRTEGKFSKRAVSILNSWSTSPDPWYTDESFGILEFDISAKCELFKPGTQLPSQAKPPLASLKKPLHAMCFFLALCIWKTERVVARTEIGSREHGNKCGTVSWQRQCGEKHTAWSAMQKVEQGNSN